MLGEFAVLLCDMHTPMDCAIKAMLWNNSFLMCSTTDSTTPKTDMSHMTHTAWQSLVARLLLLVRLVLKPFRVHRGANT